VFQHVDANVQVHEQQPGLGPEALIMLLLLCQAASASQAGLVSLVAVIDGA
jgi:hypothetical protein